MKSNTINRLNRWRYFISLMIFCTGAMLPMACGISASYSMSGSTTDAETISIVEFYNNADLGPANMSQVFTNDLKNYFIRNSNLTVVAEEGQLQLEGEISDLRITPISPTSTGDPTEINRTETRLEAAANLRMRVSVSEFLPWHMNCQTCCQHSSSALEIVGHPSG